MTAIDLMLALVGLTMVVVIWRLAVVPDDAGRAIAADFGFVVFVAGVGLLAARLQEPVVLILVLAATLLGFLATVAFAHLLDR